MNVLLVVLVVIVVMALIMWAIYYLPLPPGGPAWIKNFLYVLVIIVAVVIIVSQTGVVRL